ncbi:MAG: MFS transporter, partial [Planctomycetes bacterium]|nr:MFS transporter [Planctomycetota bacterium]
AAKTRVELVQERFERQLAAAGDVVAPLADDAPIAIGSRLDARRARALFEDMALSRLLDVASRELKKTNRSFYTIGSSGHEANACVGALLRIDDPCFLHYRSGGLMMARARQLPGSTPVFDTLLSFAASAEDPISGGRHKVWGSRPLWVPPQTSTIASHLPKAVGLAVALGVARRNGVDTGLPHDAIAMASFGDASSNHATAQCAFNAARYSRKRGSPVPVLFLCEDNEIGISVATPRGWIEETFSTQPGLEYVKADGSIDAIFDACARAIDLCRSRRVPVFLHLRTVRLFGHAGTDVETGYRALADIERDEARDPLALAAARLLETGAATADGLRAIWASAKERVFSVMDEACARPKLTTREQVMAPLFQYDAERVRESATGVVPREQRVAHFDGKLPEEQTSNTKRTLAAHVNAALHDEFLRRPELIAFGEDVGRKGGVYYVTADLQKRFGVSRCFDTLLDETTILGIAQGAAHIELLPIPEIQYLAYLHNALDQLRGEACSLAFFSNGQFQNPMVVRLQGLAYQKGFGGHFHNDNSIGALRDIPGLMLCTPARGDDAVRLLRGAIATAKECGRVVVFLEPIALYHERDLHDANDGAWLFDYPPPGDALLPGEVGIYGEDAFDLLLVSYANGVRLSLRAARALERERGVKVRVLDLRWLNPLPYSAIRAHANECGRVLVVDECRATAGGVADAIVADLTEHDVRATVRSVRAADSYVPLGGAANTVLVQDADIVAAALEVLRS